MVEEYNRRVRHILAPPASAPFYQFPVVVHHDALGSNPSTAVLGRAIT